MCYIHYIDYEKYIFFHDKPWNLEGIVDQYIHVAHSH